MKFCHKILEKTLSLYRRHLEFITIATFGHIAYFLL